MSSDHDFPHFPSGSVLNDRRLVGPFAQDLRIQTAYTSRDPEGARGAVRVSVGDYEIINADVLGERADGEDATYGAAEIAAEAFFAAGILVLQSTGRISCLGDYQRVLENARESIVRMLLESSESGP